MATKDLGKLYFQIAANTDALNKAQKDFKQFSGKAKKDFNKAEKSSKGFITAGRVAAVVAIELGRRVTLLADDFVALQTRIRTASKGLGSYTDISKKLFKVSQQTATSLKSNVDLFQGLSMSATELQASSDQIMTLVKTVGQLGAIGGTSGEGMANAMLQFQQGLAGGVFRAEEFNALIENMQPLVKELADGFGKTTGQLRNMVLEGKLLSKDVFKTLLERAPLVNKQFAELPITIRMAWQVLQNGWMKFVGNLSIGLN